MTRTVSRPAPRLHAVVDRKALEAAVGRVDAALPVRAAAPVLAGMVMQTDQNAGTLTLKTFDYDISVTVPLPADVSASGALLLHGRTLRDLVKKMKHADALEFRAEGSKAVMQAGPTRFELQTLPIEDYPRLPPPSGTTVSLDAQTLFTAIRKTIVAAARDDTIPMLTGVKFEFEAGQLSLAATDRFRLALASEIPYTGNIPDTEALIPWKALRTLTTKWGKHTGPITVDLTLDSYTDGRPKLDKDGRARASLVGFFLGEDVLSTRALSGEFVRYRSLFPAAGNIATAVEFDISALAGAAGRVALAADRTSPIRLDIEPGRILLQAGAGDELRASEPVTAELDGAPAVTSFNPGFLIDGLSVAAGDKAVLFMTTPAKPVYIEDDRATDGFRFRYLMLPLRVSGQGAQGPDDPTADTDDVKAQDGGEPGQAPSPAAD